MRDSVTVRVTFDRGLDTRPADHAALFTVKARTRYSSRSPLPDPAAAFDSAAESAVRARRTPCFGPTRSDAPPLAAASPIRPPRAASRSGCRDGETRLPARAGPKPSRPSPLHEIVLQLGAPLKPGAYYRLQAIDVRGLLGKTRTSDHVFSMPKPTDPSDSRTAARATPRGRPASAAG